MNCQKCKIEIEDRDLGRESVSDAAAAHMASCASCRVFGEERLALRRLIGGLEKVSAPADFDFRMRARMLAERDASASRTRWFNFSPAALSWPLAGCLAVVISASLYFQQKQPDTPALPAVEQERVVTPSPQTSVAEATPGGDRALNGGTRPGVSLNRVTRPSVAAASQNNPPAPRERALPTRLAERRGVGRELVQIEESNSAGLLGSTPRLAASESARTGGALIPVQLDAPEGQLKVLLRDTSGGARTISVDSVSFGSRDVIGRPGVSYTRASLSTNQGVW